MLRELWDSSTGLLARFNVKPTVEQQYFVFQEEVSEFTRAIVTSGAAGNPIEEGADVIVTVLNTLYAAGFNYDDVRFAIEAVCQKNDAKTWDSHYINPAGKIQRRGRK